MSELAARLKSERLRQGLTLRDISESARISIDTVEALEEGRYDQIGTSLLIRSFLRAYCSTLGIDPQPVLEEHDAIIRGYDRQEAGIRHYGNWSKSIYGRKRFGIFPALILIAVLGGSLYGGFWLWKTKISGFGSSTVKTGVYPQQELPSDLPKDAVAPAETAPKQTLQAGSVHQPTLQLSGETGHQLEKKEIPSPFVAKEPQHTITPTPSEVLPEEKPPALPLAPKNHRFEVEATQKTWIGVVVDKKNTESVVLKPGEKREWEVKEAVQVELGHGTGVSMKWDGQPLAPMGKTGRSLRFTLPLSEQPQQSMD